MIASQTSMKWTPEHGKLLMVMALAPTDVGQRIKDARIRKGWTQLEFALEAHVSPSSVTRWESGKLPPLRELYRIAELLDVALDQLIEAEPTNEDAIADLREEVAELRGYAVRILQVLGEEAEAPALREGRARPRRPA